MNTTDTQLGTTIKHISAEQTYKVRQEVLRKGKPISSCYFQGDEDEGTFHLGIFSKEKILGVATFLKNKNDVFSESNQYQLRGMAILPQFQGSKLGKKLLFKAEDILGGNVLLWFNARESAQGFYSKYGYEVSGTAFEIEGIGRHFLMFKKIN